MRIPLHRLRWLLLAGALLLVAVLAAYIGLGRFRALSVYRALVKRSGATISHDTNGFTYSQTEKGRTVFILHASKATQVSEGQWSLHDVAVTLYGRLDNRTDHIYGSEFTYDEKQGVVRAIGEVHMDLQAPQSLAPVGRNTSGDVLKPLSDAPATADPRESNDVIHVRTSGLVYLRALGVAATDQPVEFHYGGVTCTAVGAEFNTAQSTLRLLANVAAEGVLRGQPFHLTAARADVDRTANIATMTALTATSPAWGGRALRDARADRAVLHLRPDGSIESARATGNVSLRSTATSAAPGQQPATQTIQSAQLDATLSPQSVPQTATFSGGVTLLDTTALRPLHGTASTLDIRFDVHGQPSLAVAEHGPAQPAAVAVSDQRVLARGLARSLQGDRITALFTPTSGRGATSASGRNASVRLTQVVVLGNARASSETLEKPRPSPVRAPGPAIKTTTLIGDSLHVTFVSDAQNQPEPQQLNAAGHTLLQQDAPLGEQETSSGDTLEATFAQTSTPGGRAKNQLAIASAVQTGHVVVHRTAPLTAVAGKSPNQQQVGSATADRALYDGTNQRLTLTGNAYLHQDNATLSAETVVLEQPSQDADALGHVQATLESASATGTSPTATDAARAPQVTHVLAASAHLTHETRQSEFRGTDAQPARLWQQASQVEAAVLLFDDVRRTFAARPASPDGWVHAVFAGSSAASPTTPTPRGNVVRVISPRMDYSDAQREAVFTGNQPGKPDSVEIIGTPGTIHAQRAVAYLTPATNHATTAAPTATGPRLAPPTPSPLNGSIERIVITGDVQLDQPGRHGTGEQLVYTAATGNSVLTGAPGHPPHITDAQQGSVTGASLLFGDAGSTIVVTGEASENSPAGSRSARVHTETQLQSGATERHPERQQSRR